MNSESKKLKAGEKNNEANEERGKQLIARVLINLKSCLNSL